MENESPEPQTVATALPALTDEDLDSGSPGRRDGWTPFARRLFLEVLAETGRVTTACNYAGLTKQSAYALRARDPVFAAGWDAACELARTPLADALYEQAVDGLTETITRNGEVVAERHRFDARLSVAVLHRLDKRCERAAELGARHLPLLARWDDWLTLVGKGDEQAARALLESRLLENASHGQFGQLPEGGNPTEETEEEAAEREADLLCELSERCWIDGIDHIWLTDFPPPPGFTGYQSREFDDDDDDERYVRVCTPEEVALLEAGRARARADERSDEEALRDYYFAQLAPEPEPAEGRKALD